MLDDFGINVHGRRYDLWIDFGAQPEQSSEFLFRSQAFGEFVDLSVSSIDVFA